MTIADGNSSIGDSWRIEGGGSIDSQCLTASCPHDNIAVQGHWGICCKRRPSSKCCPSVDSHRLGPATCTKNSIAYNRQVASYACIACESCVACGINSQPVHRCCRRACWSGAEDQAAAMASSDILQHVQRFEISSLSTKSGLLVVSFPLGIYTLGA